MGNNSCCIYRWECIVYMETLRKINERAYEIYEARLYWNMPGDQLSDWLQAEVEVNHITQFHIRYDITEEVQNEINHHAHITRLTRTGY